VEEQFYIFYPILLTCILRFVRRFTVWILLALCLVSFILNLALNYVGGGSPAFFMFPTRAWELLAGASVAASNIGALRKSISSLLSAAGLGLLLAGLLMPTTVYFGIVPTGLPVVLGSVCIITAGIDAQPFANRWLAASPFVSIGKMSYSLYLWHWPIVVLWQYYYVQALTIPQILIAFAAMIALAQASTSYIERPARSKNFAIKKLLTVVIAVSIALLSAALFLVKSEGLPNRLSKQAAAINAAVGTNYRCPVSKYLTFGVGRACELNLPSRNIADAEVMLLGNSHAQMYAPLWESFLKQDNIKGVLVPQNGCLPTTRLNAVKAQKSIRLVILGLTWDQSAIDTLATDNRMKVGAEYQPHLQSALDELISELQASGKTVILIGPIATPNIDIASETSRQLAFNMPVSNRISMPRSEFDANFGSMIKHFAGRNDIGFLRPDFVQCTPKQCDFIRGDRSFFADSNHFASSSLYMFHQQFLPIYLQQRKKARIGLYLE
jgi:hypothetical protein